MGSRDRPAKEVKKKPKDKSTQQKLAPMSESPQPRWNEESGEG